MNKALLADIEIYDSNIRLFFIFIFFLKKKTVHFPEKNIIVYNKTFIRLFPGHERFWTIYTVGFRQVYIHTRWFLQCAPRSAFVAFSVGWSRGRGTRRRQDEGVNQRCGYVAQLLREFPLSEKCNRITDEANDTRQECELLRWLWVGGCRRRWKFTYIR